MTKTKLDWDEVFIIWYKSVACYRKLGNLVLPNPTFLFSGFWVSMKVSMKKEHFRVQSRVLLYSDRDRILLVRASHWFCLLYSRRLAPESHAANNRTAQLHSLQGKIFDSKDMAPARATSLSFDRRQTKEVNQALQWLLRHVQMTWGKPRYVKIAQCVFHHVQFFKRPESQGITPAQQLQCDA